MPFRDAAKKAAYSRKWAEENVEKRRAACARWRKANPERARAATIRWKKANPEKVRDLRNSWRKKNTSKVTASQKRQRDLITRSYIKKTLGLEGKIPAASIPQTLIELKREQLKTFRAIRKLITTIKEKQNGTK